MQRGKIENNKYIIYNILKIIVDKSSNDSFYLSKKQYKPKFFSFNQNKDKLGYKFVREKGKTILNVFIEGKTDINQKNNYNNLAQKIVYEFKQLLGLKIHSVHIKEINKKDNDNE
ncbi:MAG: hypothetical protein ACOCRX_10075 [Candidatus Woesearchaeota archaeon]